MSEQQFSNVSLMFCLSGLIIIMVFIIWDLGKKSKADKMSVVILFVVLGLGFSGFLFKNMLLEFMFKQ